MQQNHQKAQIVVFAKTSKKMKVLLFQTNKKRGSFWQNITGSVEKNESYLMGALREFREETGISDDTIQEIKLLKCDFKFTDLYKRKVSEKCFAILLTKKCSPKLDAKEHQNFKWHDVNKISEENYKFPSNFQAFCEAKKLW